MPFYAADLEDDVLLGPPGTIENFSIHHGVRVSVVDKKGDITDHGLVAAQVEIVRIDRQVPRQIIKGFIGG